MNDRPTLREKFHKIGSLLFEITLASGFLKDSIKEIIQNDNMLKDSAQLPQMQKTLDDIEKAAMNIDSLLSVIKDYTYERIDPDSALSEK